MQNCVSSRSGARGKEDQYDRFTDATALELVESILDQPPASVSNFMTSDTRSSAPVSEMAQGVEEKSHVPRNSKNPPWLVARNIHSLLIGVDLLKIHPSTPAGLQDSGLIMMEHSDGLDMYSCLC